MRVTIGHALGFPSLHTFILSINARSRVALNRLQAFEVIEAHRMRH